MSDYHLHLYPHRIHRSDPVPRGFPGRSDRELLRSRRGAGSGGVGIHRAPLPVRGVGSSPGPVLGGRPRQRACTPCPGRLHRPDGGLGPGLPDGPVRGSRVGGQGSGTSRAAGTGGRLHTRNRGGGAGIAVSLSLGLPPGGGSLGGGMGDRHLGVRRRVRAAGRREVLGTVLRAGAGDDRLGDRRRPWPMSTCARSTGTGLPGSRYILYRQVVEAAARKGVAVEVSSQGLRNPARQVYPSPAFLEMFRQAGVPITLASDGHVVSEVAWGRDQVVEAAREAGYEAYLRLGGDARQVPLPEVRAAAGGGA